MAAQLLTEVSQSNNLVEQLSSRAELEDYVIVLAGFGKIDKLDDIRMI